MRKRNLARSEGEVKTRLILKRVLERRGYEVYVDVRASDVLEPAWVDLDRDESYCLRTMHFDCVVAQGARLSPQFVVEFDGPHHREDATAARLDAVKNKFCQDGGLPIVRITSRELESNEKVELLDWMLERWLAWQKEDPEICREIAEKLRQVDPVRAQKMIDSWNASLDPGFIFDLRHPYPAILTVAHRLHRLGVITLRASDQVVARLTATRKPEQLAQCIASPRRGGPVGADSRYLDYEAQVRPWEGSIGQSGGPVLYRTEQRVQWRWALPVGWEAPPIVAAVPEGVKLEGPREWDLWLTAQEHLWSSELPGALSHQIADGLAEYLVLRDVEQWAKEHWATSS